jgi:hypothetical protein
MATISAPIYDAPEAAAPLRRAVRFASTAALRVRTALGQDALDAALVQGADRASRPELALRADQLERPGHRQALSRTVRRLAARATFDARRDELIALADRLDSAEPASAAGIALAARLVGKVLAGPRCADSDPQVIGQLVRSALATMDDERIALSLGSGPLSVLLCSTA